MSDAVLEYSLSGKGKHRQRCAVLACGSKQANRECAVSLVADLRLREGGYPNARVWLGDVEVRATEAELQPYRDTRERLRADADEAELAAVAW